MAADSLRPVLTAQTPPRSLVLLESCGEIRRAASLGSDGNQSAIKIRAQEANVRHPCHPTPVPKSGQFFCVHNRLMAIVGS
jgi:hypothetical protein